MEMTRPARIFEALAHETRLAVFRLLIPAGRDGLAAGAIGSRLGLPANSLSFHLARLASADLVRARRQGRHLYYAVQYATLSEIVDFLADDCCSAAPEGCLPECPSRATVSSESCAQVCVGADEETSEP